ncbi:MAG: Vms1/Ankzf1 family peptidyl-tRNA hydrolase [Acidimicrobiales bacterium]
MAGRQDEIRKVRGGGWSHRRYQQRAEDAWERTASAVAEAIEGQVREIGARLVVANGDLRMLQLVRDRLADPVAALVREVPGSRSEDGSADDRDAAAQRWVRTAVAEDTRAVLARFDEELGQGDRAAAGWDDVLAALRESRRGAARPRPGRARADRLVRSRRAEPRVALARRPRRAGRRRPARRPCRRRRRPRRAPHRCRRPHRPHHPRLADGIGALLRW